MASSSFSINYDYSGLDELIKRQDAVGDLRGAKRSALYGGDVAGAMAAGGKIRDLVSYIRAHNPLAPEDNPIAASAPQRRIDSMSGSASSSGGSGRRAAIDTPTAPQPAPPKAAAADKAAEKEKDELAEDADKPPQKPGGKNGK